MKPFNYVVIKENYPELERETVLLNNKYSPKKKFAVIFKQTYKDRSESITHIKYLNCLKEAQDTAKDFVSWYNYPLGVAKTLKGDLISI